ncbi:galactose mutarotase-like domain-containing protein [Russula earlei]|uniref:Galactose mutarotase-like domain-containing protein n=1 Tax=Russula earlei TaxID=71964 RepID=A0ACC0UMA1_9AGAM|nr:galactose mutarotase-like domain-containing protein [Russula earlei]
MSAQLPGRTIWSGPLCTSTNDILALQIDAAGTQYAADATSQRAFETLIDADQWMIYRNVEIDVLHWDFVRSYQQPSFGNSAESNGPCIVQVYNNLVEPTSDANAGRLIGNRNFYSNDYMVQRGPGYVVTLKMYSTRTRNTECVNSRNRSHARWNGLESFVGGVSNGQTGAAAMRYLNPLTSAFSWVKPGLKDDTESVMVANVASHTSAPVYSVLDQRRHSGDNYVNGEVFNGADNQTFAGTTSLWHGGVGYLFGPGSTVLSLSVGGRRGDWSRGLNIRTMTQPISYAIFPDTTFDGFQNKKDSRNIVCVQNDAHISAILDLDYDTVSAVFWDVFGGYIPLHDLASSYGPPSITFSGNVGLMHNFNTGELTVSEPSQTLTSVDIVEGDQRGVALHSSSFVILSHHLVWN